MSRSRHDRVSEIFIAAFELEGDARDTVLASLCGDDAELRAEVEALLREDRLEGDALAEDALDAGRQFGVPATILAGEEPPVPRRFGQFRILGRIGEGGMGTVYEAEQEHPQRRVALKVIRSGVLSPSLLARFRLEAELLGRLQHPGIAQIHEAGEVDTAAGRQPYFAMEYIDGPECRDYARRHDLDSRGRLELAARIGDAVHHAHQKGIVHRDLKPDNVLVVDQETSSTHAGSAFAAVGQPKVLDFGVARATDSDIQLTMTGMGNLVGTVPYMSPEQVAGTSESVDARSDVYALGVILYELLAGRLPHDLRRKPIPEATRIIREEEPSRLGSICRGFRGDIETIVAKALEKDVERRYQSAAELSADIRRYLASKPIEARPAGTFYQLGKFARRNRAFVAGLVLSALILVLGTVVSLALAARAIRGEKQARDSEQRARREAYRFGLAAAEAMAERDPWQALAHLEATSPDLRGWAWKHLDARLRSHIAECSASGGEDDPVTFGRQGSDTLLAARVMGGAIEVLDLATGETRGTFEETTALSRPLLSPRGDVLAALSVATRSIVLWDVATGKRRCEARTDPALHRYRCFSPDGRLLAVAVPGEGLRLVETDSGRVRRLTGLDPDCGLIAFSPDGLRLAYTTTSFGAGYFRLAVCTVSGRLLARKMFGEGGKALAFGAGGDRLVIGTHERNIRIVDAATLDVVSVLRAHGSDVTAVAPSPDGRYLASSARDRTTRIWDLATGRTLRTLASGRMSTLAFSGDGARVAAGSAAGGRLWTWRRGTRQVLRGHESYVYFVAFSPDGSLLASCAWDSTVRLWDPLTGELLATLPSNEVPYRGLGFTADGTRLISSAGGALAVWDPIAAAALTEPRTSSDRALFELLDDGSFSLGFARSTRGGSKAVARGAGIRIASSPDGASFVCGTREGEILVRRVVDGRELARFGPHMGGLLGASFGTRVPRVASFGRRGTIQVWDPASGARLATLRGHLDEVYCVEFSPDGTRIASGGNDRAVFLWDARSFTRLLILRGHESYVHSLAFSPDGTMLASGSGDGTVCIWDSVPRARRFRELQRARALRARVEPLVTRWLEELGDPLAVAQRLRTDPKLDARSRQAAGIVLLRTHR